MNGKGSFSLLFSQSRGSYNRPGVGATNDASHLFMIMLKYFWMDISW
jgi:hypothetical protein